MTAPTSLLGDVCQTFTGGTPSRTKSEYFGGGIPWVKITDMLQGTVLATEESLTDAGIANSSAKILPVGTVLISIFATIGRTAVLGIEAATNQAIAGVVPKDTQRLQSDYLRYYLDSRHSELNRAARGVAQPNINQGILKSLEIPIPPLSEQRRIVDLLSRAEGIVRLRREAEKKAAELIPALFLDMFGDPATNPKGWAKMLLGDLCSRITDGTHQPPSFQESGIPFIFVANIVRGELTLNASKFISEETYTELTKRCPIERDDVLYSTVGSFGVPVKVDTDERFSFQRHIAHLKPYRDRLDSDFLVGMLSTPALKGQADAAARGIAQKTINLGEIRKFQVIAPPIEAQKRFAVQVEAARCIQSQQATATAKAQAAFDALLARSFS